MVVTKYHAGASRRLFSRRSVVESIHWTNRTISVPIQRRGNGNSRKMSIHSRDRTLLPSVGWPPNSKGPGGFDSLRSRSGTIGTSTIAAADCESLTQQPAYKPSPAAAVLDAIQMLITIGKRIKDRNQEMS